MFIFKRNNVIWIYHKTFLSGNLFINYQYNPLLNLCIEIKKMHLTKNNIFFIDILYAFIEKNHTHEIPIGSLIIKNNALLAIKKNSSCKKKFLDHAECLVIKEIITKYNKIDFSDCILITSLEPCIMCIGTAMHANIKLIYYLCRSDQGIHTKYNINLIHNITIIPLLLYEDKINTLIKDYFRNKR